MRITAKTELYIISFALILALIILGIFWVLNRGGTPTYSSNQTVPSSIAKPVASDAIKSEPSPVTHRGLAKITEPSTVSALVLGDSIAESSGASNKDLASWYALVASDLHSKYPGTIQWNFKTNSAASLNDVLKFVPSATQDTDLIVLCLGRHDVGSLKLTEFKQKYEQLLVELKAKSPHADLFLVVEPPVKSIVENNKFSPYHKIILDLGQKYQLSIIDEWTAFINDPLPLASLLADNVNPNDKGYRVFADAVLKSFNNVLSLAP